MYDVMIKPNFTLRLKQTNKQEQHANGPLSAGMAGAVYMCVCVCVSEAMGMEGLLCERNQKGMGL